MTAGSWSVAIRRRRPPQWVHAAAVYTLAPFIFNFGGQWLDKDNQPLLSSPPAVKGLEMYGRMLREYGPRTTFPPGLRAWHRL